MKLYALDEKLRLGEPEYSNLTYRCAEEKIEGYVDGLPALKEAIRKILSTERFEYPIYSFYYGIEMKKLIGQDALYVKSELKRMIEEALARDNRITDVGGFSFKFQEDICRCTFNVTSIFGEFEEEVEMKV